MDTTEENVTCEMSYSGKHPKKFFMKVAVCFLIKKVWEKSLN